MRRGARFGQSVPCCRPRVSARALLDRIRARGAAPENSLRIDEKSRRSTDECLRERHDDRRDDMQERRAMPLDEIEYHSRSNFGMTTSVAPDQRPSRPITTRP